VGCRCFSTAIVMYGPSDVPGVCQRVVRYARRGVYPGPHGLVSSAWCPVAWCGLAARWRERVHRQREGQASECLPVGAGRGPHPGLQIPKTTYNAEVETIHNTIEFEFFEVERFLDRADFFAKASGYQLWYNCERRNCNRHNQSPLEILRRVAPGIDQRILLLPALDLDAQVDRQVTSVVAAMRRGGHDVPGPARALLHGFP